MQDRILPDQQRGQPSRIADIPLHDPQLGIVRQTTAEKQLIIDGDFVAGGKQPWGKDVSHIAGPARNQDLFHSQPLIRGELRSTYSAASLEVTGSAMVNPAAFASR